MAVWLWLDVVRQDEVPEHQEQDQNLHKLMVLLVYGTLPQRCCSCGVRMRWASMSCHTHKHPGWLMLVGPSQTPNMVEVVKCHLVEDKHEATSDQVLAVQSSKDAVEEWWDVKARAAAEQGPQRLCGQAKMVWLCVVGTWHKQQAVDMPGCGGRISLLVCFVV